MTSSWKSLRLGNLNLKSSIETTIFDPAYWTMRRYKQLTFDGSSWSFISKEVEYRHRFILHIYFLLSTSDSYKDKNSLIAEFISTLVSILCPAALIKAQIGSYSWKKLIYIHCNKTLLYRRYPQENVIPILFWDIGISISHIPHGFTRWYFARYVCKIQENRQRYLRLSELTKTYQITIYYSWNWLRLFSIKNPGPPSCSFLKFEILNS